MSLMSGRKGKPRRLASRGSAASHSAARIGKVSQWGNSLGVRIPQNVARQLHLTPGAEVSMEVRDQCLTIRPSRRRRKKWSEAELLKGVTPEKVGGEIDWGGPVGREVG